MFIVSDDFVGDVLYLNWSVFPLLYHSATIIIHAGTYWLIENAKKYHSSCLALLFAI